MLATILFGVGAQAATIRVLPAPAELRFDVRNVSTKRFYAKGDVLVRAFVLSPETARLREAVSVRLNGADIQIGPQELLVKGLVADISGSWLFRQKGQLRSGNAIAFCTYREKSPIEQGVLFGKQNFERCLIDQDNDGRFDAFFVAGSETGDPQSIQPAAYSLDISRNADPSNRIEVSFDSFVGKRTIILQTKYFLRNKRRSDITSLLVTYDQGMFDYQGGALQGGRCFYRRPDEGLLGRIHVLGVPVDITRVDRNSKMMEASVGIPVPATLFTADSVQRWIPTGSGSCGGEPT